MPVWELLGCQEAALLAVLQSDRSLPSIKTCLSQRVVQAKRVACALKDAHWKMSNRSTAASAPGMQGVSAHNCA